MTRKVGLVLTFIPLSWSSQNRMRGTILRCFTFHDVLWVIRKHFMARTVPNLSTWHLTVGPTSRSLVFEIVSLLHDATLWPSYCSIRLLIRSVFSVLLLIILLTYL